MQGLIELYKNEEAQKIFSESNLLSLLVHELSISKEKKIYENNELVIQHTKSEETVCYIIDGAVSVEHEDAILYFMGKKRFLGLESLLFQAPSHLRIKARGTTEVWEFKKIEVMTLLMSLQEGWLYGYLITQNILNKILGNLQFMHVPPLERGQAMLRELVMELGQKQGDTYHLSKQFNYELLTNYLQV
ncbi:Crp/Fnr family transcriptional regulator, partial [Listeria booriae]